MRIGSRIQKFKRVEKDRESLKMKNGLKITEAYR